MPQKIESQEIEIYRIKVTLVNSKPPIWRRIEVQSHASLYKLQDHSNSDGVVRMPSMGNNSWKRCLF